MFYEPLGAWYHATKFAVEGFSDSLRIELAPFGIDVVIIEPGPIRHRVEHHLAATASSRPAAAAPTRSRPSGSTR